MIFELDKLFNNKIKKFSKRRIQSFTKTYKKWHSTLAEWNSISCCYKTSYTHCSLRPPFLSMNTQKQKIKPVRKEKANFWRKFRQVEIQMLLLRKCCCQRSTNLDGNYSEEVEISLYKKERHNYSKSTS